MAKKCNLTGTGAMSGNNVSHANNRTRRRFLPNLQVVSLLSETLGKIFKLKVTSATLRSIEHNGGLDSYLESTSNSKLTEEAKKIKKSISKRNVKVLVVLAYKRQSVEIFRLVKDIDPNAFISQSSVIGVYGEGFDKLKGK